MGCVARRRCNFVAQLHGIYNGLGLPGSSLTVLPTHQSVSAGGGKVFGWFSNLTSICGMLTCVGRVPVELSLAYTSVSAAGLVSVCCTSASTLR
jgi:hypothetical protein